VSILISYSMDAGAMHIGTSHDTLSSIMEPLTIHFHRCIGSVHHFFGSSKNAHVVSRVFKFTSFSGAELAVQEKLPL
jgi:hypothetical protein